MTNPEEINRICTDHVASLLLASTLSGLEEMKKEGIADKGAMVGDPMYDAFVKYSGRANESDFLLTKLSGEKEELPDKFYYLTCHREENTKEDKTLAEILKAMNNLDVPTVYPVHPRNKERALRIQSQYGMKNVILSEPVGYLESIFLVNHAKAIVTDSGGLQREAFFAGKKCVTILDFVVWPETMIDGRNILSAPDAAQIAEKLKIEQIINKDYKPFGDGKAAEAIVREIERAERGFSP